MGSRRDRLLIRADADARMGTGHLMRCLALAQAWHDVGGQATFLTACRLPEVNAHLSASGAEVETLGAQPGTEADAEETWQAARRSGAGWVVLDGYHFSATFQGQVRREDLRVLAVDDYGHAGHYSADLVLNQNLHAREELYQSRGTHTRLLLGTRFALLRREFRKWHDWKREIPEVASKVLVTLGGSDPANVTLKVTKALQDVELQNGGAMVVVGCGNPHLAELETAARCAKSPVLIRSNVTDMPVLMAWADVAVSAGGTTSWERALLRLPTIVLVLADNQREVAASCAASGISFNLGPADAVTEVYIANVLESLLRDRAAREKMAHLARGLVDGEGADRVQMHLTGASLRVRPVRANEGALLWEWVNDPIVRQSAFQPQPIPQGEHLEWFSRKLADDGCRILIGLDASDVPVGQARFESTCPGEAVIDVSMDRYRRGSGFGSVLIDLAVRSVFTNRFAGLVHAYIKRDNQASIRAFQRAGFQVVGNVSMKGHEAVHAVRRDK